jgi:hypothetical protein
MLLCGSGSDPDTDTESEATYRHKLAHKRTTPASAAARSASGAASAPRGQHHRARSPSASATPAALAGRPSPPKGGSSSTRPHDDDELIEDGAFEATPPDGTPPARNPLPTAAGHPPRPSPQKRSQSPSQPPSHSNGDREVHSSSKRAGIPPPPPPKPKPAPSPPANTVHKARAPKPLPTSGAAMDEASADECAAVLSLLTDGRWPINDTPAAAAPPPLIPPPPSAPLSSPPALGAAAMARLVSLLALDGRGKRVGVSTPRSVDAAERAHAAMGGDAFAGIVSLMRAHRPADDDDGGEGEGESESDVLRLHLGACRLLRKLCADESSRQQAAASGVLSALVESMAAWPRHPRLLACACHVLHRLVRGDVGVTGDERRCMAAVDAGALGQLAAALSSCIASANDDDDDTQPSAASPRNAAQAELVRTAPHPPMGPHHLTCLQPADGIPTTSSPHGTPPLTPAWDLQWDPTTAPWCPLIHTADVQTARSAAQCGPRHAHAHVRLGDALARRRPRRPRRGAPRRLCPRAATRGLATPPRGAMPTRLAPFAIRCLLNLGSPRTHAAHLVASCAHVASYPHISQLTPFASFRADRAPLARPAS